MFGFEPLGAHLIAEGLAKCLPTSMLCRALMIRIQLLEAVQHHDRLLAYQLLGVVKQLHHAR